jgi:parallel beta-helix repeat protein
LHSFGKRKENSTIHKNLNSSIIAMIYMNKRILAAILALILASTLNFAPEVMKVKASETIYIKADGSIDPPTANITRDEYNVTYTFTDNNYDSLRIERSNIIVNGSGFKLQGSGYGGSGLYLNQTTNVTIINMEINNFGWSGIALYRCSNITISKVLVTNNDRGIDVYKSSNSSINESNITRNEHGIVVTESSNIRISENNITKNYPFGAGWVCSIELMYSLNVTINGNNITDNENGIAITSSSNNTQVSRNSITANREFGISIYGGSSKAILSDNLLNGNQYEFGVSGWELHHFLHTIDTSNLIDGKPIYYLLNQQNVTINNLTHPQVGYLALINSTTVTIENLNLTSNLQGLLLAYTNNTQIQNNNITNNENGIELYTSSNNTLVGNTIAYNGEGILLDEFSNNNRICKNVIIENTYGGVELEDSFGNVISENNITANYEYGILLDVSSNNTISGNDIKNYNEGIELSDSSNNTITGNTIRDNVLGIAIYYSSNNLIHHNNLISNADQVYVSDPQYQNSWDDSIEGNYWSNYTGGDFNHDGIGDSSHILNENNTDNKPLMGTFNSLSIPADYYVNVVSNSTVENFQYFQSNNTMRMYVSNSTEDQTHGFCRITIPHELVNMTKIQVIIDDGDTEVFYANYTIYDNGTHRWIYFAYPHSTHKIDIIPELQWSITLFALLISSTITLISTKKKQKTNHHPFFL